ncbi:MAG: family N-acetyltransferase [Acidobacteria bacterium]|nr:family N-acetyltransferase [Acidobacteriota bacterium]
MKVDGYEVAPLARDGLAELQRFLERCNDFFELCEGGPVPPHAAVVQFEEIPSGYSADDHFTFCIRTGRRADRQGGELIAFVNLFRNYPRPRQWWVGFQIVDPSRRGAGLGAAVYAEAERWMADQGAEVVQLAVAEPNHGAERFWRRMGFADTETQPYTTMHGTTSVVIMMRKPLASPSV